MSKVEHLNGEYYHVFNRGVDKRDIFLEENEYQRFLETVLFVNDTQTRSGLSDFKRNLKKGKMKLTDLGGLEPLVSIICYCFNSNHYHFILRQEVENGVSMFMGKLNNSYTKYFNTKHDRSGPLFSGKFKSAHIDSNEYLLFLSAYVNGNNYIHGYNENIDSWPYSSFNEYKRKKKGMICDKDIIIDQFDGDCEEYVRFMKENVLYMKDKKAFQKYLIE